MPTKPEKVVTICNTFPDMLRALDQLFHASNVKINLTFNAIRDLIPNVHPREVEGRDRRSLLPFVGQLFGSLFGTSTEDEVRQLAAHVKGVADNQLKISKQFQTYSDHMSSFVSATNDRIDGVIGALKSQQQEYSQFLATVNDSFRILQQVMFHSNTAMFNMFTWQNELDNLLNAVELLKTGKLPSYLVSSQLLSNTIHSIQKELNARFKGFDIVHFSPAYYYTSSQILTVRTNDHIFITVKFPITTQQMFFEKFVTKVFPIPLHNASNLVSEILNMPHSIFMHI